MQLKQGKPTPNNSKLLSLSPVLDEEEILRVGGRLRNSQLQFEAKHPALLPRKHAVTDMVIRYEHERLLHAGVQTTIASLRQKYWPLSVKNTAKRIIHKRMTCFRVKPIGTEQKMGDLPFKRTQPACPFINCGVDYAGPISIKEGRGRGKRIVRAYLALFVCFATKTYHLELVSDLSAESFLGALKRFVSRRGNVLHMYSDNGTNFVGANRELMKLHELFKSREFDIVEKAYLEKSNITWHFIPPRSPHFGGLWESGIKLENQV